MYLSVLKLSIIFMTLVSKALIQNFNIILNNVSICIYGMIKYHCGFFNLDKIIGLIL